LQKLAQKTEIVIEYFRQVVAKKISGRAKAMFVTSSRKLAKRYFEEFNKYIKENDYTKELRVLVAFSGYVVDDRETIFESFQPYYERTIVADEPEINHLVIW